MNPKTLICKVFEVIHRHNLDYCVQNKYEMMPDEMPSDIDMFYRNASEKDLDSIVLDVCNATGTVITQKIATGYYQFTYNLSYTEITSRFQFQLDFYNELSSSQYPHVYLPSKMLNTKRFYKCFYVPAFSQEVCYQVVRRVMKKDMDLEHITEIARCYAQCKDEAISELRNYWGEYYGMQVCHAIEHGDVTWFANSYTELQKVLRSKSKSNTSLAKRLKQLWFSMTTFLPYRILHPVGMSVAILAPDGGGKSTIISRLEDSCSGSFDVMRRYFRPGLFKNVGQYKPNAIQEPDDNPNPHGKKPNGLLKSYLRYLVYNVDFIVGYLLIIWPAKIKRKLVIFDRYYYDYYADIYRYHYSFPKKVPHLFSFLIPSPDLVFVLNAPAEVLYKRKQELSINTIEYQLNAFLQFARHHKNTIVIDVDRNIDDIVKEITSHILIYKNRKVTKLLRK